MKHGLILFLSVFLSPFVWAQNTPALTCESDEYSTYILPNLANALVLLDANQEQFKGLMKEYRYQEFHRGNGLEYLAPSSRVNQMRLIRKERKQVQFLLSPTKLSIIQQLEKAIKAYNPVISKDFSGMTWYQIDFPTSNSTPLSMKIGIKMEEDSEDRVGRTWAIWSSTIIFSR
ncbi:hypothetical protein ACS6L2_11580 [Aquirufa ecclesiirivi]